MRHVVYAPSLPDFDSVCSDRAEDKDLAVASNRTHSCIVSLELPFEQ